MIKCIVCNEPAGSGEHVFPACLGGRRVNKNIYCRPHDNGYSALLVDLAHQMAVFNAMLGVVPDHSDDVKSVTAQDTHSGQELRLSVKESSFTAARVISQRQEGNGVHMEMSFPNREAKNEWLAQQKANGFDVKPLQKAEERTYFLGEVRHQIKFGGQCGLGAVGYVTQTFLAQEFPDMARSGDISAFIAYTQAIAKVAKVRGGCEDIGDAPADPELVAARRELVAALEAFDGKAPVWWDFDPQPDSTPNAFEFGHRVTVGVDAADGQIFGRFSLFSTINFGMRFGTASAAAASKTVTVDIDPMAPHPPNDIQKVESASAGARVASPSDRAAGLAAASSGGAQEAVFSDLVRRIEERGLAGIAAKMHAELSAYLSLPSIEGDELLRRVVDGQAQRVLNLTKSVLRHFNATLPAAVSLSLGPVMDSMVAHDTSSLNGLSPMANATLELAKSALVAQMREDIKAGRLNERRIAELMGDGPGAAVIGELVLPPIMQALPS